MQIITVFRFENSRGAGPWWGGAAASYDDAQQHEDRHSCGDMPCPYTEWLRGSELGEHHHNKGMNGYHFGFASTEQLKESFPCSVGRTAMGNRGQRLTVWEVDEEDVLKGNAQVAFKRDKARMVGEYDLATLKPVGEA